MGELAESLVTLVQLGEQVTLVTTAPEEQVEQAAQLVPLAV